MMGLHRVCVCVCVNMLHVHVCEYIHTRTCVLITSLSLTHETQLTLLWDQPAVASCLGFDKLYVKKNNPQPHGASSSSGAGRGGSLKPMSILKDVIRKGSSQNEFHLAGWRL